MPMQSTLSAAAHSSANGVVLKMHVAIALGHAAIAGWHTLAHSLRTLDALPSVQFWQPYEHHRVRMPAAQASPSLMNAC